MNQVMCAPGTNASALLESDGQNHLRAIDIQFIQKNNCTDPCNQINAPSIFRQQNDLVLLEYQQALLWSYGGSGKKFQKSEKSISWATKLLNLDLVTLPFILVQGFVAVLFGRRDPREIRDLIYIKLFMERKLSRRASLARSQDFLVRFIAALNYLLAVAVIILCPPLFIASIVSAEIEFWSLQPDSEAPYAIGQWGPWVIACQVLLAALIARYHDRAVGFMVTSWRRSFPSQHKAKVPTDAEHDHASAAAESGNVNLLAGQLDIPPNDRPKISPLQTAPKTETGSLRDHFHDIAHHCRQMISHPLNRSDHGIIDEIENFVHWCKDPPAVSRLVVRHPLRRKDVRDDDSYLADEREGEIRRGDNKMETSGEFGEGRLESGFFHGASMKNGPQAQK